MLQSTSMLCSASKQMAAHKVHFLLSAMDEVTDWCASLDRAFMEGYGLMPDPMEEFEVSYEKLMKGIPTTPFTVCFETDDADLAILFKLRFAEHLVEWPSA